MSWFRANDPKVPLDTGHRAPSSSSAAPPAPEPAPAPPAAAPPDASAPAPRGRPPRRGRGGRTENAESRAEPETGSEPVATPARGGRGGRGGCGRAAPPPTGEPKEEAAPQLPAAERPPRGRKRPTARGSGAPGPVAASFARIDSDFGDDDVDSDAQAAAVQAGQSAGDLARSAQFVGAGSRGGRSRGRGRDRGQGQGRGRDQAPRQASEQALDVNAAEFVPSAAAASAPAAPAPQPAPSAPAAPEQQQAAAPTANAPRPRPPVRPNRQSTLSPLERDLAQLNTRFPGTIVLDLGSIRTARLHFAPSDPDFPFELPRLDVELRIPETYPAGYPRLTVLTADIPPALRRRCEGRWERFAQANAKKVEGRLSLVGLVNWLDRELEGMLVSAEEGAVTGIVRPGERPAAETGAGMHQPDAVPASLHVPEASEPPKTSDDEEGDNADGSGRPLGAAPADVSADSLETASDESDSESDSGTSDGDSEGPDRPAQELAEQLEAAVLDDDAEGTPGQAISDERRGTHLRLPGLHHPNISLLQPHSLHLLLRCGRCRAQFPGQDLPNDRAVQIPCPRCAAPCGIRIRPSAITADPQSGLAYIDSDLCAPAGLLPASSYTPTCSACAQPTPGLFAGVERGETVTRFCRHCHRRMEMRWEDVRFVRLGEGLPIGDSEHRTGAELPPRKKTSKLPEHPDVIPGKPLPNKGACADYTRSFRWFRFPCCGMLYPCDLCHERGKADSHPLEWATRMVCGHCGREQGYRAEGPCSRCGADMRKRNPVGGFWEGGKGTRDRAKMNRREKRKYQGMGKTESKKAERVGKKA
ncbi:hypothetical protein DFJ74DRAFT_45649 [Hyaloraphidium curvatum]|nr:hypothetical protein DFJ74DRAFT_45649 [Hyaloraphidium curvatum]